MGTIKGDWKIGILHNIVFIPYTQLLNSLNYVALIIHSDTT